MTATIHRSMLGAAAAITLFLASVGCEDSQAAAQRNASLAFEQALAASQKALPGGRMPSTPEEAMTTANELRRIAQSLASSAGGTPAQKSSALLLASNLNRKAAEIDLMVAASIEISHRMERLAVARAAAAAANLEALAVPLDRVDFAGSRTMLKTQRDLAEGQLRQLQNQMRTLESAVAQVDQQLAATEEEARRLDAEAEQLRAQAQSLRPRQALPYIEQAAELSIRNADLRGSLGRQQSERSVLAPQLASAKTLGAGGVSMLAVTDSAIKGLQELSEKARESAAKARRGASEIRAGAKTRMDQVLATMAADLDARYEAALGSLERGTTQAQQASTGSDPMSSDSARIAQASAQLALAQALVVRGLALTDHAALLRQLDALGGWGESAQLGPAATKAEGEARDAITRAKEQYTAAIETIGMLRTPALVNSGAVAGLRTTAEAALAELERPGSSKPSATGGELAVEGAGHGAPTPELLVEWLNAGAGSAEGARRAAGTYRSSNAALVTAMQNSTLAMEPVLAASERAYGKALEVSAAGGVGLPSGAKLVSVEEDSAKIELQTPMGPQVVPAVKVDGAWYLDIDGFMEAMLPGQGAVMAAQMIPTMNTMAQMMGAAARAFAARIDAGEFPDADAAEAAFTEEMMKAMGAMMGGAGGAPPG